MALSVTECREQDLAAVSDFFGRHYRPDYVLAANDALLRWQFGARDGAEGRYHIKLAWSGNRLVGSLGYIPVDVTIEGSLVRGAWTANWMVDPECRHLGVGPRLMASLTRDHDVTLVVGASTGARQILPRLGFTEFGELRRFALVLDPVQTALLTGRQALACPRPAEWAASDSTTVTQVSEFTPAIDAVWSRVADRYGAGTSRTAAFLNWRYAWHPHFSYRLFVASRNGEPCGFAVYRVEPVRDVPVRVGRVVKLIAVDDAADRLLSVVRTDAREQGVAFLDLFCSSSGVEPLLLRNGWCGDRELVNRIPMLFQPVAHGRTGIPFLAYLRRIKTQPGSAGWYVTKGDGDQDRPN